MNRRALAYLWVGVVIPIAASAQPGPPTISKAFGAASVRVGETTSLSFTITNPNAMTTLTGIGFTDSLPSSSSDGGLAVAVPNGLSGACGGGTITAVGTNISLSGATLAPGATCVFSVIVTGTIFQSNVTNKTSNVISNESVPGSPATASINVFMGPPTITKSFQAASIRIAESTGLTITVKNPNGNIFPLSGIAYTDTLPAGLVFDLVPLISSSNCPFSATIVRTAGSFTLSNLTLSASAQCSFTLPVIAVTAGVKNNVTSNVTSTEVQGGGTASATLEVVAPPTISKSFGASVIAVGGTTSLTFTITNPNTIATLTGVGFSDTLPAGLLVASPNGLTGSCGGGTITATAGSNVISLVGATIPAGGSCIFGVNVTSVAAGVQVNTTGPINSVEGGAGAAASATIRVVVPFAISYAANLNSGDSVFNITNTGENGAGLASGTTASITGAICANVYAFSPDEQLIACCSCPVTPNGLVSLSARTDLISNTLTPAIPTSIVVKVLATAPISGSCIGSAANPAATLASGMAAFGTSLHPLPVAGTFAVTETPFVPAQLSKGELNRLTSLCTFIIANGSGFGVCRSCRLGGLGADRQ